MSRYTEACQEHALEEAKAITDLARALDAIRTGDLKYALALVGRARGSLALADSASALADAYAHKALS